MSFSESDLPENPQTPDEESLFHQARRIADVDRRRKFLDQSCRNHPDVQQRVELLLRISESDKEFLEAPVEQSRLTSVLLQEETEGSAIGRYQLVRRIAAGGMGIVWEARQNYPVTRTVALKIVRSDMAFPENYRLFHRERQILATLDHPGIPKLLDAGEADDGRPWFVMEYVDGVSISKYCAAVEMSGEARVKLLIPAAEAVRHCHQRGIIHRDLKPGNILVAKRNDEVEVRIIDFGVAVHADTSRKSTSQDTGCSQPSRGAKTDPPAGVVPQETPVKLLGTPEYMSPEQVLSGADAGDERSDVYALGAVLYVLLTDVPPLHGPQWQEMSISERCRAIPHLSVTPPSQRSTFQRMPDRTFAADVDSIILRALEGEASHRYQDLDEFINDLKRLLQRRPVLARPRSMIYTAKLLLIRCRTQLFTTAIAGLCFALLITSNQDRSANRGQIVSELPDPHRVSAVSGYAAKIRDVHLNWLRGDRRGPFALPSPPESSIDNHSSRGETFEKNFLTDQQTVESRIVSRHKGRVFCVVFSPDGQYFVAGSGVPPMLTLHAAGSGEELFRLTDFAEDVSDIQFSHESRRFFTTEDSRIIREWEIHQDGAAEISRLTGLALPAEHFFLSANESAVGVSGLNYEKFETQVSVWDRASAAVTSQFPELRLLAVDENRSVAATVPYDGPLSLRSFPDLKLIRELEGNQRYAHTGEFSPDGRSIATGNQWGELMLWDLDLGRGSEFNSEIAGLSNIRDVSFTSDGRHLLTAHHDGVVRVWDVPSRTLQRVVPQPDPGDPQEAWTVDVSPDNQQFVVGYGDGSVRRFASSELQRCFRRLIESPSSLRASDFDDSCQHVAVVNEEQKNVSVISLKDQSVLHTVAAPEDVQLERSVLSSDGRRAWITDSRGNVWQADFESAAIRVLSVQFTVSQDRPIDSPFSPLIVFSPRTDVDVHSQFARVCHAESGEEIFRLPGLPEHPDDTPHRVTAFRSRDSMITVQRDSLQLWNPETQTRLPHLYREPGQDITQAAPIPHADLIAIASKDGTITLWDPLTGTTRSKLLGHRQSVTTLTASGDGLTLASGSRSGEIRLWHIPSGEFLFHLRGARGEIHRLAFSPDNRQLYAVADINGRGIEINGGEVLVWGTSGDRPVSVKSP